MERRRYKQKKPVIFYWYTPQYLNGHTISSEVKLPPRTAKCKDDEKKGGDPKQYACAYRAYPLDKLVSGEVREERLAGRRRAEAVRMDG